MRSPFLRRFGMPSPFFDNETGFSPAALFALAEPGVWLDPSDVANLDWRRNLLTYTEQFNNAAWTKVGSTITVNATTAPDGTTTADKIVEDALTSSHGINPATFTFAATTAYTASIYVKAAERTWVYMQFSSAPFVPNTRAWFNLSDGTTSQVQNSTATITSVGNGWYRCTLTATSVAGGVSTTPLVVGASTGSGVSSYAGDGTSGVFMWGAQLEIGSVATAYQPITDVNTEVLQRFPTTTMFVDRFGSTAVTTPGQEVGLRLDKSKGLVLGSELVTNGTFDTGLTGWTVVNPGVTTTSVSASGVTVTNNGTDGQGIIRQTITSVVGRTYKLQLDITSAGRTRVSGTGGFFLTQAIRNGTFSVFAIATGTTLTLDVITFDGAGGVATFDNISVKELAGNHAQATADLNRGIYGIEPLGGTRNLLTYTEQFDNAAWLKTRSSISANVASAPDGTNTADKIVEDTSTNSHFIAQSVSVAANASMAISIYAKPSGRDFLAIATQDQAGTFRTSYFNLSSGTVGTVAAGQTASILSSGDGWYRCTVVQSQSATSGTFTFYPSPAAVNGSASYAGDGTSGILVWGAQLELGTSATTYQRVVDQYNVTQAGVPSVHYVQYDGSDDFYVTPTIDPSSGITSVGSEFVTNGDFSDGTTGWLNQSTGTATFTVSGGVATISGADVSNRGVIRQELTGLTVGASYRLSFTGTGTGSIGITTVATGTSAPNIASVLVTAGSVVFVASAATLYVQAITSSGGSTFTLDDISVRAASRPADKVQVFAGARKVSDAAAQDLVTFGFTLAGSFVVMTPRTSGINSISWRAGGSTIGLLDHGVVAPATFVTTGLSDISADVLTLRYNGAQVAQSTADQGTGNFSAYPMYIGRRGGTTLSFSGRDYGIIVRFGANLTETQIADTEVWMNQRTGAY